MNHKLIEYIQSEVVAVARQKYPDNERLQWIYVYGFMCAQFSLAVAHDNRILSIFKAAVRGAKTKK
jgi:hypothetical protein